MSVPLTRAVEETGRYLDCFPGLADGVTVQQLAGYPWPHLTLGTLRALHDLAKDMCDTAGAYSEQELERAIDRRQR